MIPPMVGFEVVNTMVHGSSQRPDLIAARVDAAMVSDKMKSMKLITAPFIQGIPSPSKGV